MGSAPVFWMLLAVACVAAMIWGGGPERAAAAMFVVATLASHLVYRTPSERFYQVEIDVLVVDLLVFAGMIALVVLADRFWPILMAAVTAMSVAGHIGKMFGDDWVRLTYAVAIAGPSYLTLVILVVAVGRHHWRLRRLGHDHSWNNSLTRYRRRSPSGS